MIIHQDYPCTSCEHYSSDDRDYNHWVCDFDHDTCPHIEALHKAVGYKKRIDADVLDRIRAEIEKRKLNSDGEPNRELAFNVCLQIIDKYKASPTGAESDGGTQHDD